MQRSINWSYRPYKPFLFDSGDIYICRVAPEKNAIKFEWLPAEGMETDCQYQVWYRTRPMEGTGASAFISDNVVVTMAKEIHGGAAIRGEAYIYDLKEDTDYEFYVATSAVEEEMGASVENVKKSRVRLARTGKTEGIVVNYLHPDDKVYSFSGHCICSPSLVRHSDGYLLSSMDVFKALDPQNLTLIFRSDDEGKTWHYVSELMPCFWGKMFIHKGDLYMLACSTEFGDLLIGKSTDGGRTFPAPTVLLRGPGRFHMRGVHKNPQNIVSYKGRLYATLEWGSAHPDIDSYAAMVMSCSEEDDLLDVKNWHFTTPLPYDPTWPGVCEGKSYGNIEGTPVVAPDGRLLNIMRYDTSRTNPGTGRILAYEVDIEHPDASLRYSHAIEFPANNRAKFMIKYDTVTGKYFTIACGSREPGWATRNLLTLLCSDDLEHWKVVENLLDYRDKNPAKYGFQYCDFEIEGEDIIFLCRTAMNEPVNHHDANYQTFHRIENFRKRV